MLRHARSDSSGGAHAPGAPLWERCRRRDRLDYGDRGQEHAQGVDRDHIYIKESRNGKDTRDETWPSPLEGRDVQRQSIVPFTIGPLSP